MHQTLSVGYQGESNSKKTVFSFPSSRRLVSHGPSPSFHDLRPFSKTRPPRGPRRARCLRTKEGGGMEGSDFPSPRFPAQLSRRNLVKLASFRRQTLSRGQSLAPAPPQREFFIPSLIKFLGTCGIRPSLFRSVGDSKAGEAGNPAHGIIDDE